MTDYISRADAEPKRVLQGHCKGANTIQTIRHEELTQIANTRKAVESADAIQGEWIIHGEPPMYVIECSQCGQKYFNHALQEKANFCSNCGARMKGGAE